MRCESYHIVYYEITESEFVLWWSLNQRYGCLLVFTGSHPFASILENIELTGRIKIFLQQDKVYISLRFHRQYKFLNRSLNILALNGII